MLAEYRDVVPLVNNPVGWGEENVKVFPNENPWFSEATLSLFEQARQETIRVRVPMGDTNGPKAALRWLSVHDGNLAVYTDPSEYFVLWGLPHVAPELHQKALDDLKTLRSTDIPFGISTHNLILLSPDGSRNPENTSVVAIINNDQHGFAAGRLSVSYEGMLDPTVDLNPSGVPSTFETVKRTLREEFGIANPADIRLLAVCAEKQTQYTSWCHAVWIEGTAGDLLALYGTAPRRNDSKVLFSIPLREIDAYAAGEIGPHIYARDIIRGTLAPGAILNPHPTVPWRVDALRDHLAVI